MGQEFGKVIHDEEMTDFTKEGFSDKQSKAIR
jgi:hypothetical protein